MPHALEAPPAQPESLLEWLRRLRLFLKHYYVAVNVTTTYTVPAEVYYVRANATGGAFTVTLPLAATRVGRVIIIKKIDSSVNAVTVGISGSDTIEGSATVSLAAQWNKLVVIAGASGSWEKVV
jgi:hypothetical protein